MVDQTTAMGEDDMTEVHHTTGGSLLLSANSVNKATRELANLLTGRTGLPVGHTERRGNKMREFYGAVTVEITNPRQRVTILNGRRANPWVSLAEFPWLIAGRNDVEWLGYYLPRAKEFSDDGKTWRAGYGPRLRRWGSEHFVGVQFDQLKAVVDLLLEDPMSRQAVIQIWDPLLDLAPKDKLDMSPARYRDYPCTNWLHFQIKDGALDLTVVMRSNDLIWGFSAVNVMNFTLLQELVAAQIGRRVGAYRHVCDNLHVYERHLGQLEQMAGSWDVYDIAAGHTVPMFEALGLVGAPPLPVFTQLCEEALKYVTAEREKARNLNFPPTLTEVAEALNVALDSPVGEVVTEASWIVQWAYFMCLYPYALDKEKARFQNWYRLLSPLGHTDWKLAAASWLSRNLKRNDIANNCARKHARVGMEGKLISLLIDKEEKDNG